MTGSRGKGETDQSREMMIEGIRKEKEEEKIDKSLLLLPKGVTAAVPPHRVGWLRPRREKVSCVKKCHAFGTTPHGLGHEPSLREGTLSLNLITTRDR